MTFAVPSKSQKDFLGSAAAQYAADLAVHGAAQAWLMKRALSEASARSFQLGVVANPLPSHEQYRGRLAIPYLTLSGVCGMAFRCLESHDCKEAHGGTKYLYSKGDSRRMFNTPALDTQSPWIAICEGEMDTIAATQAGVPAVGVPGVTNWQRYWARCFKGFDTVYILADADDVGQGSEMAKKIESHVPQARTILMPQGHDVNSLIIEQGPEALIARIGA